MEDFDKTQKLLNARAYSRLSLGDELSFRGKNPTDRFEFSGDRKQGGLLSFGSKGKKRVDSLLYLSRHISNKFAGLRDNENYEGGMEVYQRYLIHQRLKGRAMINSFRHLLAKIK